MSANPRRFRKGQGVPVVADFYTLAQVAYLAGVTADSLRQRVHRRTLAATKAGNTWIVTPAECDRVVAEAKARRKAGAA